MKMSNPRRALLQSYLDAERAGRLTQISVREVNRDALEVPLERGAGMTLRNAEKAGLVQTWYAAGAHPRTLTEYFFLTEAGRKTIEEVLRKESEAPMQRDLFKDF